MNKSDLALKLALATNRPVGEVQAALDAMLEAMTDALMQGGEVHVRGFGRLFTKERNARQGRNPRTGEEVSIPAKRLVRFAASDKLLLRLNGEGWSSVTD